MTDRRPDYDLDWTIPPRAADDAGTPTAAATPRGEILTIAQSAIDLYLEYEEPGQHDQTPARAKAMREVIDSLEAPSPTLAAMLGANELVKACQMALDWWHLDTRAYVARYGEGSSSRDVGDVIRAALAKAEASS